MKTETHIFCLQKYFIFILMSSYCVNEHISVSFCHKVIHLTAGAHDGIVGRAGTKSSLSIIPEFKSRLCNLLLILGI